MTAVFSMKWKCSGRGESGKRSQRVRWTLPGKQGVRLPEFNLLNGSLPMAGYRVQLCKCAQRRTSPHPSSHPPEEGSVTVDIQHSFHSPSHATHMQVCQGDLFFAQRCYPLAKPCPLWTTPPRGGGRSLFLNLIKILYMLIAALAKFFLVAYDVFTLHVLTEKELHPNQSMSGRNSEKITVTTTTLPHSKGVQTFGILNVLSHTHSHPRLQASHGPRDGHPW